MDEDKIDPAYLALEWRCDMLLKDPSSYIMAEDTNVKVWLVPDKRFLEWSETPLVTDPEHCPHTFSVCSECANSWGQDYWIRFIDIATGTQVWISPDHPDHGGESETPPLFNPK
jgi:hypothetical protein